MAPANLPPTCAGGAFVTSPSGPLTPEALGLHQYDRTYLADAGYVAAWIGDKWDIGQNLDGRFSVFRKGNWVLVVGSLDLALAIVADNEGCPNG